MSPECQWKYTLNVYRYNSSWHSPMYPAGVPLVWWAGTSKNVLYCICYTPACPGLTPPADPVPWIWQGCFSLARPSAFSCRIPSFFPQTVLLATAFQSSSAQPRKREAVFFMFTGCETKMWAGERVERDISLAATQLPFRASKALLLHPNMVPVQ